MYLILDGSIGVVYNPSAILYSAKHRRRGTVKGSKFFVFVLIIILLLYLLFQLNGYLAYRELLPQGTTISGLEVGGLTEEQVDHIVEQAELKAQARPVALKVQARPVAAITPATIVSCPPIS